MVAAPDREHAAVAEDVPTADRGLNSCDLAMNWIRRRMNAPAKKWSMNEAWLGARMTGPLGTFSEPNPRARNVNSACSDGQHAHRLVDLRLGLARPHPLVELVEVLLRARVLVDLRLELDVGHV